MLTLDKFATEDIPETQTNYHLRDIMATKPWQNFLGFTY